jgi:hypothetical protein
LRLCTDRLGSGCGRLEEEEEKKRKRAARFGNAGVSSTFAFFSAGCTSRFLSITVEEDPLEDDLWEDLRL